LLKKFYLYCIKLLLLSVLVGLLSSCGFHLRGSTPIPKELKTLYIQSRTPFGQFEQVLRDTLTTYKVNIVTEAKQAPIILNIISANLNQTAGAVSTSLTLRQYTLTYTVTYQVLTPAGKVIIPTASVSSTASLTTDMNQMMSSSNNITDQYLPDLQRDAVSRMIYRLFSNNSRAALQQYFQGSTKPTHENKTRTA